MSADTQFMTEQVAAIRRAVDKADGVLGVIDVLNACDQIEKRLANDPANELVTSVWEHRCSDGVGGCIAISGMVVDWPIVIEDAPLKCARCDKPIVGSGTGPIRSLARLISEHTRSCDG